MSCLMLKKEVIASIADYIKTLNDFGYDYFGYSIPESLNEALDLGYRSKPLKDIFIQLYAFNAKAFNSRYDDNFDPTTVELPIDYPHIYHPKSETPQLWEYQLLKTIAMYNYQVCEESTCKTALYKALKELEAKITSNIVWRMPEMQ